MGITYKNKLSAMSREVFGPLPVKMPLSTTEYQKSLNSVRAQFMKDESWLDTSDVDSVIFNPVPNDFGQRITDILKSWPSPSVTSLALYALEKLKISSIAPVFKGVIAGAVLSDIENKLPYHGNDHYKKVLLLTIRQIVAHNEQAPKHQKFSPHQMGLMMIAAIIHDLNHDGKGNGNGDDHVPFRLEQQSFDTAKPYLKAAGLSDSDLRDIEIMVLCTDVTPLGQPNAPSNLLKQMFLYQEGRQAAPPSLPMKLSRLIGRPDLIRMAMVVESADIGVSAGLSFEQAMKESRSLAEETGIESLATVESLSSFVKNSGDIILTTSAGQKVFGSSYNDIKKSCDQKINPPKL